MSPETASIVDAQNVSVFRNGSPILRSVSWRIAAGEHWALLGANGSGKTTLLKIMAGYEWPSEGTISVLGNKYGHCDLREHRKQIGWVSAALEQKLPGRDTVLEIVLSGIDATLGVYRAFDEDEIVRARECLRLMNLNSFANRTFGTLSQGEQQRALIARALVRKPALLILDEPCAGLDPAAREGFLENLDALAAAPDAPALVLVTHHIEEIRPWVSRVLALREGAAVYRGPTGDALTNEVLGTVFERPCWVVRENGRYRLDMRALRDRGKTSTAGTPGGVE